MLVSMYVDLLVGVLVSMSVDLLVSVLILGLLQA